MFKNNYYLIILISIFNFTQSFGMTSNEKGEWKQFDQIQTWPNEPTPRSGHSAFWTGTEMLIWGGYQGENDLYLYSGGLYNPRTNTWRPTSLLNVPVTGATNSAIWTGSEMLVVSIVQTESNFAEIIIYKYNPSNDIWTHYEPHTISQTVYNKSIVWTGSELIIWAKINNPGTLYYGTRFNPLYSSWLNISSNNAPLEGYASWLDTEMLVLREQYDSVTGITTVGGSLYNNDLNLWNIVPSVQSRQYLGKTIWTGTELIIWGGGLPGDYNPTGSKYNPNTNSWSDISVVDAPSGRSGNSVVWTGEEMIIWGGASYGYFGSNSMNTGGLYNPTLDKWSATSSIGSPSSRFGHTAVWTNKEMIVWGGGYNPFSEECDYCWKDIPGVSIYFPVMDPIFLNSFESRPSLNDTGVIWAGDSPSGNNLTCASNVFSPQDCNHGRDVTHNDNSDGIAGFSFTKLDGNGNDLPANATTWSCVRDNVTKLIWENKATVGIHSKDDKFSWYNNDSNTNGGQEGLINAENNSCYGYVAGDSDTYCNSDAFVNRVNTEGLCGFIDWKFPDLKQLTSIIHYGTFNPSIDTNYFPRTNNFHYYSSNTVAYNLARTWNINFAQGNASAKDKNLASDFAHIRLVRLEN